MGGVFQHTSSSQIDIRSASTTNVYPVSVSATPVVLLPNNPERKGCLIYNDSVGTLVLKFGQGVSDQSVTVKISPESIYEMALPVYTGIIEGFWTDTLEGKAFITELM